MKQSTFAKTALAEITLEEHEGSVRLVLGVLCFPGGVIWGVFVVVSAVKGQCGCNELTSVDFAWISLLSRSRVARLPLSRTVLIVVMIAGLCMPAFLCTVAGLANSFYIPHAEDPRISGGVYWSGTVPSSISVSTDLAGRSLYARGVLAVGTVFGWMLRGSLCSARGFVPASTVKQFLLRLGVVIWGFTEVVSAVEYQSQCRSCWAFTATLSVSSQLVLTSVACRPPVRSGIMVSMLARLRVSSSS